jgi:signal transduction histidine kinase/CheY-like chemotaxis protein/HPt (histidine-containing phosphotransfer) domain-containing protein
MWDSRPSVPAHGRRAGLIGLKARTMQAEQELCDLIAGSQGWLTSRIIHYAKTRGYTPYTSTLEQAWVASICGISEPLIEAVKEGRTLYEAAATADFARDPIANYGIEVAQRHRTRGITLGLFLGLMKSYRLTYLDLVDESGLAAADKAPARSIINNFFDRMEVGFCEEWAGKSSTEQIDQLSAQNRLITNEKNKYITIFESLKDPVILVSEAGEVENMNFAAARLFTGETAPGAIYYGGAHQHTLSDLLGIDIPANGDVSGERQLETRLGRRCFDIKMQRMLDVSERHLGTVLILVDVTEYRQAKEQAEAANKAKSTFLATMSHEIRTPIHGMLGVTELLQKGKLGEEERVYVEAIARSSQLLSSVVADILDYSKIEAGVLDLERTEFSVGSVVEDVFGLMQPLVNRKPDLRILAEIPALPQVIGDPGKLRQVLLNLAGNAVKFTERGVIRIAVREVAIAPDDCRLRFDVADTGIGIDPRRIPAIFEPFTQSDNSIARRFGGSGLGLAICRRLIDRMGGVIEVDSIPGQGSLFSFTVPFERSRVTSPSKETAAGHPADAPPARALDVLVVEDDEVNALVAKGLLQRLGHRPRSVGTGGDAVAEVCARDYDLVLVDLRLPDMDGIEVTRRIRSLADPKAAGKPIVALSAHALRGDIQECLDAGMNDFLSKPFRSERLEAMLHRVLGVSSPHPLASPVAAEAAEQPALVDDHVLLDHAAALGAREVERIVMAFQESVEGLSDRLERAAGKGSPREVADIAHRLKSASRHVGLNQLSARAAEVERAARGGSGYDHLIAGLAVELQKSSAALDMAWQSIAARQPANT